MREQRPVPVNDVSAMFVATMTFLRPSLVASKISPGDLQASENKSGALLEEVVVELREAFCVQFVSGGCDGIRALRT